MPFKFSRSDWTPGACNGCSAWSKRRFNKYTYSPEYAQTDYREVSIDCRQGVNLTTSEAKVMADIVAPLLKNGQSPYQMIAGHPELGITEKTLYNYIESDVFHEIAGITVMDLRRQVSRKISKRKSKVYKNVPAGNIFRRQNCYIVSRRTSSGLRGYRKRLSDSLLYNKIHPYPYHTSPLMRSERLPQNR